MRNKRVAIGLAVFNAVAASVSIMPASFAQETPPGGGGIAPSAPPPSVQTVTPTQPNPMQQMMQNAIQQQQLMNQIHQSFFNPFINANPSVSPMDQRSGTTNNASSGNAGSKPSQSLGISSTSAPNIGNTSISGSGGSQPVNDPSKLGQLMVLGSKGQPLNLTLNDLAGFNAETLLGAILNFAVGNGAQINADDLNKLKTTLAQSGVSIENFRDVFAQIVIGVASGQISPEMVNNFVTALGQGQGTSLQTISARMQEAAQKVREAQTSKPSGTSGSSASSSSTSNAAFMSALAPLLGALGSASSASGVARAGTSTVQSTAQTTAQTTAQIAQSSATSSVASGVTSVMSSLFGSSSSGSLSSAKPSGSTTAAPSSGATITMVSSAPRTGSTGMQTSIGGVSSSGGISKPSGTGYMNLGQSSSTSSSSSASAPAAAPAPTKPPAAVTATSSAITSVVNTNFSPQINSALGSVTSALRSLFKKFP